MARVIRADCPDAETPDGGRRIPAGRLQSGALLLSCNRLHPSGFACLYRLGGRWSMGISSTRPHAAGAPVARIPAATIHEPVCARLPRWPRDVSSMPRHRQAGVRSAGSGAMPAPPTHRLLAIRLRRIGIAAAQRHRDQKGDPLLHALRKACNVVLARGGTEQSRNGLVRKPPETSDKLTEFRRGPEAESRESLRLTRGSIVCDTGQAARSLQSDLRLLELRGCSG